MAQATTQMTGEQILESFGRDVASISQDGKARRKNHVRDPLHFDPAELITCGKFVRVLSDIFKTRASETRAVC